jgi:hypothetical protein
VGQGINLGNATYPTETGHCTDTSATTCLTTPATEASFLASESHIMLSHILDNNPRVQYDHQTDLIGPDYTLLALISNMLSQYNSWYNSTAPITQMTDTSEAQVLGLQSAWSSALTAGTVTATEENGVVTVTNSAGTPVNVPITVPPGTTVNLQSGYHQFAINNDSLCLDVYGASSSAGAAIDQWTCKSASQGNTNQEFQFVPTSAGYGELQAQNSGDDVAVAGSSTVAGVPDIVQQSPNGASNSQWLPIAQSNGSYEFENQNSGLCLDVYHAGSNLGQQLDQWPCKSPGAGTNQAFALH